MQMVFHLGVHGTDRDRLLKTLLNNRDALQGIGSLLGALGSGHVVLHGVVVLAHRFRPPSRAPSAIAATRPA